MSTLDIRWPLGLIFASIGGILVVYGALLESPGGADINIGWGAVLGVFGAAMLLLARRAALAHRATAGNTR